MADKAGEGRSSGHMPRLLRGPLIPESDRIFKPASPNRRGEAFAWLSTLGMLAVNAILFARTGSLRTFPILLLLGFGLAAALISFSNWMDGNTEVRVSPEGIHYHSPVRDIQLAWGQIGQLRAGQVGGSWRVAVEGEEGGFHFRTGTVLGESTARPFRFGFLEGEALVSLILGGAGLTDLRQDEATWICRRPGHQIQRDGPIRHAE
jgi:hypothetical protein